MGRIDPRLLALTALLVAGCSRSHENAAAPPTEERPQLVLEHMVIQSYGPTGIEWQLASPLGKVFAHANVTRVRDMRTQIYQGGKPGTLITSEEAIMRNGPPSAPLKEKSADAIPAGVTLADGDMYLDGNVVVVSTDSSKLTTDWMHYEKKEDLIVSTAPVKIVRSDSVTEGVGMEATPDLSRVQIFHQTLVIPDDEKASGETK